MRTDPASKRLDGRLHGVTMRQSGWMVRFVTARSLWLKSTTKLRPVQETKRAEVVSYMKEQHVQNTGEHNAEQQQFVTTRMPAALAAEADARARAEDKSRSALIRSAVRRLLAQPHDRAAA
jgi:hypothetical protein